MLQRVPKAHLGVVSAALRSVFAQEQAAEIEAHWDAELMLEARRMVLAESMAAIPALEEWPTQHRSWQEEPEPTSNHQSRRTT